MVNKISFLILCLFGTISSLQAQDILTKADALAIALENNFDIQVAENDIRAAKNNASTLNSGYLPSLTGSAGIDYTVANITQTRSNGDTTINGIRSDNEFASIQLDYTIFNGLGRKYDLKILQLNYDLSELQARIVIENALINLFSGYYEIARLTQNELNQRQTLEISRERLLRAEYNFDYGQNNKLDILNAEVDYNNDSINYLNIVQQLQNEKRNLNLLIGRDIDEVFTVDTTLIFKNLIYSVVYDNAKEHNANYLQEQNLLVTRKYDEKANISSFLPEIGVNASANFNRSNNPAGFVIENNSFSGTIGASLSWNLFDGGSSVVQQQNRRLAYENQKLILDQAELSLDVQLQNAWNTYKTALFVMRAEQKNVQTNELNFSRSKEQYQLGQITSIEFRQAQFNLLSAQLNANQAKYSAKNAELALLRLGGFLLEAEF